jgi:ABC-type dipeptide/oligopeptide/nickel transport system permease component
MALIARITRAHAGSAAQDYIRTGNAKGLAPTACCCCTR